MYSLIPSFLELAKWREYNFCMFHLYDCACLFFSLGWHKSTSQTQSIIAHTYQEPKLSVYQTQIRCSVINHRNACTARVAVAVLGVGGCVCVCVVCVCVCACVRACVRACVCVLVSSNLLYTHTLKSQKRDTNGFIAILE